VKDAEIIETLSVKLGKPVGRHLYGVLGSYAALHRFARKLPEAKDPDGRPFPEPLNANRGILDMIPDGEFRRLAENEARRPEPTAAHVGKAFEVFLRSHLQTSGFVVLSNLEMLFAYGVDLDILRTLATDDHRLLLLLPGRRSGEKVVLFPGDDSMSYSLPTNLIAANHLWELAESE